MGNAHGHKKSSRGRFRRHSLPAISSHKSDSCLTSNALEPANVINGESRYAASESFCLDPVVAMMAHHSRCRQPSSQLFRKANEEKREEEGNDEIPAFESRHLQNSEGSLHADGLDRDDELDQDVSFFYEESSREFKNQNGRNTSASVPAHNSNHKKEASIRSMRSNTSGMDHSRQSSIKGKKSKGRRASIGSSAYHNEAETLLNNLEEIEDFLRALQKKDPEVRQRFLMESLQRQVGVGDSSSRMDSSVSHSSPNDRISQSQRTGRFSRGDGSSRRSMNDSSTRTALRKISKGRSAGMSASEARAQVRRSSTSDLLTETKSHDSWNGNDSKLFLTENLPTLLEAQTSHHPIPEKSGRRSKAGFHSSKTKRSSPSSIPLPSLTPMASATEKNKINGACAPSFASLPAHEEQNPTDAVKKKSKNFLTRRLRHLSLGDPSPQPGKQHAKEAAESQKQQKSRRTSSLSPVPKGERQSRRVSSLSPMRRNGTKNLQLPEVSVDGVTAANIDLLDDSISGSTTRLASNMNQSDINHQITNNGRRAQAKEDIQERIRSRSQSQSSKSPKLRSRRSSLTGWMGFNRD